MEDLFPPSHHPDTSIFFYIYEVIQQTESLSLLLFVCFSDGVRSTLNCIWGGREGKGVAYGYGYTEHNFLLGG